MADFVVVFDFDKTIIDCDSDNWVVGELNFTELFNQLLPTMPWNALMDRMMNELHAQGKTMEDIVEVLKRAPVHPCVIPAINEAHDLGCDLKIVSDANTFFIETILKHHGILELFSEINTNSCCIDDKGRLKISPYHDYTKSRHGCRTSICPPNMCKGQVIKKIQASISKEKKIIYLGDGTGDFCPSLKLKDTDFLMPRKDFPVWDLICKNQNLIKAEIHEWSDGKDLKNVLLQLINSSNTSINEDDDTNGGSKKISEDCKFQKIPVIAH